MSAASRIAYAEARTQLENALTRLQRNVAHHLAGNEGSEPHYGHVGSLQHITAEIKALNETLEDGFMPLIHKKNTDMAAFIGAQSLQNPAEYEDADATANARLAARLPYLFATCRFAHYLKCIVRDKIGSFADRTDMERWLNNWIGQYVEQNPAVATITEKARKPLAGAEVVVEEQADNPGYYSAKFFLQPHYQLEGLTVSLRLTAKLPSEKG